MRKETSSGAVIFRLTPEGDIQYLLLKNRKNLYWDFPKGKVEHDEDAEKTALREILEETKLTVALIPGFIETIHYAFTRKGEEPTDKRVYFFLAKAENPKVILSDEHSEFAWVSFRDAYELISYPNSRVVLERANQVIGHIA